MQNGHSEAQNPRQEKGETVRIHSSGSAAFDCYLAIPETDQPVPAVVLASPVYGVDELQGMRQPICVIWGDKDHRARLEVLEAYRNAARRLPNLDLHIFPGIQHSYMMRRIPSAFDGKARDFSMSRAITILNTLK